jgi:miniconductance mechanosensitive channel
MPPACATVEPVNARRTSESRHTHRIKGLAGAELLLAREMDESRVVLIATAAGILALLVLAFLVNWIAKRVILQAVAAIVKRSRFHWDDALLESGVFTRLSHLAPAIAINFFGDDLIGSSEEVRAAIGSGVSIYLVLIWLGVFFALLNAVGRVVGETKRGSKIPLKGFLQAVKLLLTVVGAILILATVLGKSPLVLFSGLGALTAVLLLVFRDAILGFVAGIMISANNLVQVGDWIEMPKAGADGDVIDVSLTTVKVRNWDKTITTIPTYTLISDSFKNWRGMSEAGGRRIKRALLIDLQTVRFADPDLIARWQGIDLLRDYLKTKREEIDKENANRGTDLSILGNGRRITNVGTFRAYCVAYLRAHPKIHQDMTFLVRQLAPTEKGLPLEIYVFTNDTRWAVYEGIQSDIFDHLLSVIGEFGLRVYQAPSGRDISQALADRGNAE